MAQLAGSTSFMFSGLTRMYSASGLAIAMDIERVFAAAGVPQPVDIHQTAPLGKAQGIHKLLAARQLGQDVMAAAMLAGEVGQEVGGPCRDADGEVKGAIVMLDKRIQHTAGKDATHGTAFYNQCAGGCGSIHDKHLIDK